MPFAPLTGIERAEAARIAERLEHYAREFRSAIRNYDDHEARRLLKHISESATDVCGFTIGLPD